MRDSEPEQPKAIMNQRQEGMVKNWNSLGEIGSLIMVRGQSGS